MRIGVDLDGVIYDFVGALERWCDQRVPCGYSMCRLCAKGDMVVRWPRVDAPAVTWKFYEEWGWSGPHFKMVCDSGVNADYIFLDGAPDPAAVSALWRLRELGHDIILVTARNFGAPGKSEELTKRWLSLYDIPYDELHFEQDKTKVAVDILLDDSMDNVAAMQQAGVEAVVWAQPWNETPSWDLLGDTVRCGSWDEFLEIIEEKEKGAVREEDVEAAMKRGREYSSASMQNWMEDGYLPKVRLVASEGRDGPMDESLTRDDYRPVYDEVRVTDPNTGGQKGRKTAQLGALDPSALLAVATVAGFGTEKYARYNFLKGYDWSLSFDAAQRHALAFWAGEDDDPESGQSHLAHWAWHSLALLAFTLHGLGTDDRPGKITRTTDHS